MEQLSQFTFRLLLIFIPGIIIFFIAQRLTAHKEVPTHWAFIEIFLYGILSYTTYAIIYYSINIFIYVLIAGFGNFKFMSVGFQFINSLIDEKIQVPIGEVVQTGIISFFLALIIAQAISKRWFYKISSQYGVSSKIGDGWTLAMENAGWIIIRDIEKDRIYEGWVLVYSDSSEKTEVFLTSPKIYQNSTGTLLRETDGLFLRKHNEDIIVEFIEWPYKKYEKKGDDKNDGRNTKENGGEQLQK